MMVPAITAEDNSKVLDYLSKRLGLDRTALVGDMPYKAASITLNGKFMGAVLYTNYRRYSVELSLAGEPGWITRGDLRSVFFYPFFELKCWTVLTLVPMHNEESKELHRRVGFEELTRISTGKDAHQDVILYSMTKDKCKWLPREAYEHPELFLC